MLFRAANASLDDIWVTTTDGVGDWTDRLADRLANSTDGLSDGGVDGAAGGGGVGGVALLSVLIGLMVVVKRNLELVSRILGQCSGLLNPIINFVRTERDNEPPPLPLRTYPQRPNPRNLTDEEVVAARQAYRLANDAAGHHLYANVAYSEYV